jgi:hypothetical protein
LALGLPDVRTVRKHGGGVATQARPKKREESKIRGRRRKVKEEVIFLILFIS